MSDKLLFRFDGASDNDAFLDAARQQGFILYSGIAMQLSHGWIPDFVEVSVDDGPTLTITIVELESRSAAARVSARKYLPESSQEIVAAFFQYLSRVLERCRLSADPRYKEIRGLYDAMASSHTSIRVWTAGALRQEPFIIERLPLIDQGARQVERRDAILAPRNQTLSGELIISPREHKTLFRSILILDAVVRGWDKSDAKLRAWRNLRSQPLKRHIAERADDYPALAVLLLGNKTGANIDIEAAAGDVCSIWNQLAPGSHTKASVIEAVEKFLPVDRTLDADASVRIAFERAREVLRQVKIGSALQTQNSSAA